MVGKSSEGVDHVADSDEVYTRVWAVLRDVSPCLDRGVRFILELFHYCTNVGEIGLRPSVSL